MKHPRTILKWTAVALGALVAIGLVANAWFVWATDTRLESQLAAIRQAGDPVSMADLSPKMISPNKNAATYLRRAKADATAVRGEIELPEINKFCYCDSQGNYPVPPMVQETVQSALEAYPRVIPLLEQADACSDYNAQLDYAVPPQEFVTQLIDVGKDIRSFARVLYYRAYSLVAEGKRDEAVQSAVLILRLSRHCDRNPTLVSHLWAITAQGYAIKAANVALQTGNVSNRVRETLDAELALCGSMDGYVRALKTERAFVLHILRTSPAPTVSEFLDETQTYLRLARDSVLYRDAEPILGKIAKKKNWYDMSNMSGLDIDQSKATYRAVTRLRATIRSLRVLNALQGRVPPASNEVPKLTELGLPAETITDPFTGEPLHVKRMPQGWLVYSVGSNFRDDGGKLSDQSDIGVGPPLPTAKSAAK